MGLHRPYIRDSVRAEVENRAQKNEQGQFLDANTGKAIEGQYDFGHKPGHEHWREAEKAEKEGLTQEQFNERMNNPDYYQVEDPHENRSHAHEQPKGEKGNSKSQVDEYGVDLSKAEKSNYQGQENSKYK